MKTKNLYKIVFVLSTLVVLFSSCDKEKIKREVIIKGVLRECSALDLGEKREALKPCTGCYRRGYGFRDSKGKEHFFINDDWKKAIYETSIWFEYPEGEIEDGVMIPFTYTLSNKKIFAEDTVVLRAVSGYVRDIDNKKQAVLQVKEMIQHIPSKDFVGAIILKEMGTKKYLCFQDEKQTYWLLDSKGNFVEVQKDEVLSKGFSLIKNKEGIYSVKISKDFLSRTIPLNEKCRFMAYPKGNKKLNGEKVPTIYLTGLYNNQFYPNKKWLNRL